MTVSFWQHTHRERARAYDVIVVGGGITGCSTAYWLHRRRPSLQIAVVEAEDLGAGASGWNAGFVLQGAAFDYLTDIERYGERTARRLWQFTRDNRELLVSELRGSAFYWDAQGSLTVAGNSEEDERLQSSVARLRAAGAPVVYLKPEQTNNRLHSSGFYGGLHVTTGGVVNPLQLVRHLAERSEADFYCHLPVRDVQFDLQGGVGLQTEDGPFWASRVVFAVGPFLPTLIPSLSRYVRPVRAQMLATAPAETAAIPLPVYSHAGEFYVRQLQTGEVLVGGGRYSHEAAENTTTDTTTPAVQAAIERYLHGHFPWTEPLSVRHRWSGTMGFSPDGLPVVGPVPDHPQSVFATGFTGHGLAYAIRMGRLLADRICGSGWSSEYELFAATRFGEADSPSPSEETKVADNGS